MEPKSNPADQNPPVNVTSFGCQKCGKPLVTSRQKYCTIQCRNAAKMSRYRQRIKKGETATKSKAAQQIIEKFSATNTKTAALNHRETAAAMQALAKVSLQLEATKQELLQTQNAYRKEKAKRENLEAGVRFFARVIVDSHKAFGKLDQMPKHVRSKVEPWLKAGENPWA